MAHAHSSGTERALFVALVLNGIFLLVEVVLGLWTGSLALLSDAAHMVSDVGALLLALACARLARQAGSPGQTYGWRRAEVLGAFTNGILLVLLCGWIVIEAAERLLMGSPEVPATPVLIAGVIGLGINLGSAWFLHRKAHPDDLNARGAMLHMLSDALGSVGAIVSALAMYRGYTLADPLVSILIGALVLFSTVSLLRASGRVLLEFAPEHANVSAVEATLRAVEGVADVHDLHLWSLDGRRVLLSAHLVTEGDPFEVQKAATAALGALGVEHATLQVEPTPCASPCSLSNDGEPSIHHHHHHHH